MKKKNYVLYGVLGGAGLLAAYFVLLTALNSFEHAVEQFFSMWYWILALAIGFGAQISLYTYVKSAACADTGATAEVAATGGISTASMLGCCAHHVTDVVPLIGLSAATLFISQYQTAFMVLGVSSNIVGITMMLSIIQKHKLANKKSAFGKLFRYDMEAVRNTAAVLAVAAVGLAFYLSGGNNTASDNAVLDLAEKTNNENAATISAKPLDFGFGSPVKFDITLTTHQGSLDYDLTKISALEDAEGNIYTPISWDGSPPGGHHRSGTLTFPQLKGKTGSMKLIIKNVYDVPERIFEWGLS